MARTKKPGTKKVGAPSTFQESYIGQAYEATRWGMTIDGLAKLFSVYQGTISKWRKVHPEFEAAIKKGRYAFDSGAVTSALLKRALGTEYDEVHEEFIEIDGSTFIEQNKTIDNGGKKFNSKGLIPGRKVKVVHKKVLPDTMAIMYWLQNRQPEEWKNVSSQKIETTGKMDHIHKHEHDLSKLSRSTLEEIRDILADAKAKADATRSIQITKLGTGREQSRTSLTKSLH